MRWRLVFVLVLTGCRFEPGRLAHDAGDDGDASDDARRDAADEPMIDAAVVVPACTLVLGSDHSCARRASDGTFHCVGNNSNGELGRGSMSGSSTTVMQVNVGAVTAIAGRSYHTCIATADGSARCWGENASGQLGDGSTSDRRSPVQVMNLANVVELAAARAFTCARRANGSVTCWGSNSSGQLGDNTTDARTTPATAVMGLPTAPIALAAGSSHACALFADGTGACWGSNAYGQLGDGTQDNRGTAASMPVDAIQQIAAGGYSVGSSAGGQTCVLHTTGTVSCWGSNNFGQLGIGSTSTTPSLVPVTVSGIDDAVELTMGRYQVCVRHGVAGGSVACWGRNEYGQLGIGSTTDRSVPTPVTLPAPAVHVVAGGFHTCAVLADDSVYCWGLGSSGQLGTGGTQSRTSPTASNLCP